MNKLNETEKSTIGCYSKDPDNDKHNWSEYTDCEGGDAVMTCPACNVDYFGCVGRKTCASCSKA